LSYRDTTQLLGSKTNFTYYQWLSIAFNTSMDTPYYGLLSDEAGATIARASPG